MALSLPTSWTDKNMNWDDPDPGDINYTLALREAIYERVSVVGVEPFKNYLADKLIFVPDKERLRSYEFLKWVKDSIDLLAPKFVDVEYRKYLEPDAQIKWSDYFPKRLTSSELQVKIPESFLKIPYKGSNIEYKEFFKGAKKALDMMQYAPIRYFSGKWFSNKMTRFNEPTVESGIEHGIEYYMQYEDRPNMVKNFYMPDTNVVMKGRCGSGAVNRRIDNPMYYTYVYSFFIEIERIFPFSDNRKPHIICYALTKKVEDFVPDSYFTQYNDFWCEQFGFTEGYNWVDYGEFDETKGIKIGDRHTFARYPQTPVSVRVDGKTTYKGSWLASDVYLSILADWDVPNGFKFRP